MSTGNTWLGAGALSKQQLIDTINATGNYQVTASGATGSGDETESPTGGDGEPASGAPGSDGSGGGERYDLLIIGGGSAAFAAALRTSELGGRAVIINKGLPTGGTCVNVGCVPSKTLVRTAEMVHHANHPRFEGIESKAAITDFKAIIEQKRQMVSELREEKYVEVIADDPHIQLVDGFGRFVNEHTVDVKGTTYSGKNILIATGAAPWVPNVEGLEQTGYLTNESAYELDELPESLIVLGGGYIALENAQLFSRLGSCVTVLQRSPHILSDQPKELGTELTGYLEDEGMMVLTHTQVKKVSENKASGKKTVLLSVDGTEQELEADEILVATGRIGNTAHLGLENIGIDTVGRNYVPVDETLRTSLDHIFAAGDVTGDRQFVYTAAYEGKIAAQNAMRESRGKADFSVLPWVIFTDPQVAGVGLDEQQALQAGYDADSTRLPLDQVPRAIAARDTRGCIQLVRDRSRDRLLGARILAPEGSELLMELAMAIRHDIPVESLKAEFHPYLTLSEGIKLAALTFDKDVKKLSCCAG